MIMMMVMQVMMLKRTTETMMMKIVRKTGITMKKRMLTDLHEAD